MQVMISLPIQLAEKVFGRYTHGMVDGSRVDLSMFDSQQGIFFDEIAPRLCVLDREEQVIVKTVLENAGVTLQ